MHIRRCSGALSLPVVNIQSACASPKLWEIRQARNNTHLRLPPGTRIEAPELDFSQEREPRAGGRLLHAGASESHANQRLPCICRLRQPRQTRCSLRKVPAPYRCAAQRNIAPHMTLSKVGCHSLSLTIVFWRACTWLKKKNEHSANRACGGLPALALQERQMLPESSNCSSRWRCYTSTRFNARFFMRACK